MRLLLLGLAATAACTTMQRSVPPLGNARIVSDFASYEIDRVGVVPVAGASLSHERAVDIQAALIAEFGASTNYELLDLRSVDLAEIAPLEPHRRGWYQPRTIADIARRFRLDALLIATVTDEQVFPPQRLGLQVDFVSCETGQTLWAGSVQIDGSSEHVRNSLEVWARDHLGDLNETGWELVLISPRRFARFAAYQLASLI